MATGSPAATRPSAVRGSPLSTEADPRRPKFRSAAGYLSARRGRRNIDLADLIDAHWMLTPANTWNYMGIEEAFRARGLAMPKISLISTSVHVCTHLLANGDFVTAIAKSLAERFSLKGLPVALPDRAWPVVVITLKHRTLSPVVELFIEHVRHFASQRRGRHPAPKRS